MNTRLLKQYLMSDCLSINITLNNQLSYWKGQKKWIASPTGEEYPSYRHFTLNKFKSFSCFAEWLFRSREGLNMKWQNRRRTIWGWGLHTDRLNSPPIKLVTNYLMEGTSLLKQRWYIFYKQESFKKLSKEQREWITLTKIKSEFGCAKC